MKLQYLTSILITFSAIAFAQSAEVDYTKYVNQFYGTSHSRWMIAPGPWMPMGMVKIAPDNQDSAFKAGYEYNIPSVAGFSHVHEWTMAGLLMMPMTGPMQTQPGSQNNPDSGYRSRIDKNTEKAAVGKYEVDLLDYGIHAELTATTRASMQRYTYPKDVEPKVLIDLKIPAEYTWDLVDAHVSKVNDKEIKGWLLGHCSSTGYEGQNDYKLHFVIQLDQDIKKMDGWLVGGTKSNISYLNKEKDGIMGDGGVFLTFQKDIKEVKIRTGISYVSIEQAKLNLTEEIINPFNWNFEAVVQNQKDAWNKLFRRVVIETDDELQKEKFYTNMYRAISPRTTWNDVNGKWVDMNEKVQQTDPAKPIYTSDGYWGTHWNLVQFYNLIMPEYSSNWVHTFLEMYDKGGWLPIGNPGMEYFRVMPGQAEIPIMVAAYQAGIRDYDVQKMYEALHHQQTANMENHPGGGQVGNEAYPFYIEHGFVPLTSKSTWTLQEYVSNTMEYAYQDWCVAQLAKSLGKTAGYNEMMKRSKNWRNIFDKETGFVRPKTPDGNWTANFSPYHSPGFCESNSWQYTWYVPQNMPGLIEAMGRDRYIKRLQEGLTISSKVNFNAPGDNFQKYPINHGNQSNMQSSYLFNHANAPWLTQEWTRAIQEQYYGTTPGTAYPGDEDQGQMSSWYIMSTLGLFQMEGGASVEPYYEIGSPRFTKATIHLSDKYYGGNTFVIEAKNASKENKYIQSATLNGEKLNSWRFPQKELIKGGSLILEMGPLPNKQWGVKSQAYTDWCTTHFSGQEDTHTAANMSDPDGDQIPNKIEFLTGWDPMTKTSLPSAKLVSHDSHEWARWTVPLNPQDTSNDLELQYSTDLIHWKNVKSVPDGSVLSNKSTDSWSVDVKVAPDTQYFFRLKTFS